jgi:peroxiredoxin
VTSKGLGALLLCAVVGFLSGLAWVASTRWPDTASDTAGPASGVAAPGFTLSRLEGGELSLESLRGKVVYVNLWATWCAPCRVEAPSLQRLYAELRDDGFVVVAPSVDAAGDAEKIAAFRDEFGLDFPILLDPEGIVAAKYDTAKYPETFLIGPDGTLVEAYRGPRDWDDPKYARAIRRLLPDLLPELPEQGRPLPPARGESPG